MSKKMCDEAACVSFNGSAKEVPRDGKTFQKKHEIAVVEAYKKGNDSE